MRKQIDSIYKEGGMKILLFCICLSLEKLVVNRRSKLLRITILATNIDQRTYRTMQEQHEKYI
jgi:hypothetical protein